MGPPEEIASPQDPRIADYVGLTDADLRRAAEVGGGFFIAESIPVILRAHRAGYRFRSVLATPRRWGRLATELSAQEAPAYVATQDVLDAIAGFHLHRGALAAVERREAVPLDTLLATARVLAVLEGGNDHENLGAIFRSAGALGVDAVLLDPTCADPYYRRSVRVSMGAVLTVPWTRVARWPEVVATIRDAGFIVVALTPATDAVPIDEIRVGAEDRVALLLGAEGPGLSPETLRAADVAVRVPMRPGYDSINVGHAAAIAFHHFAPAALGGTGG